MPVNNGIFSRPIDIRRDIASYFGINSGDIGYLIQTLYSNNLINRKAKYIPFEDDEHVNLLTDSIRESYNWGHTYSISTSTQDAIRAWAAPDTFFPVRIPLSKFRVLDFDGYDQNSPNWFSVSPQVSPVQLTRPKLLWNFNYEDFYGTYIKRIGTQGTLPSNFYSVYNFGFLMSTTAPSTSYAGTTKFYQVTDIRQTLGTLPDITAQEDGGRVPMVINNNFTAGTWYAIPCFTDYTGFTKASMNDVRNLEGNNLLLFPFCNAGVVTVSSSGGGQAAVAIEEYDVQLSALTVATISAPELIYEIRDLAIDFDGDDATATRTLDISVQISDVVYGGGITSGSVTVPAHDIEIITPIRIDREEEWHRFQSGGGSSQIVVTISVTIQQETATKQFTFNLFE